MFKKIHEIVSKGQFDGCEIVTKANGQSYFAALTFKQPLSNDMRVFDEKANGDAAQQIINLRNALSQPVVVKVNSPEELEQAVIDKLDSLQGALVEGHSQLVSMDIGEAIKAATKEVKASEKKTAPKKSESKSTQTKKPASAKAETEVPTSVSPDNNGDLFNEIDSL